MQEVMGSPENPNMVVCCFLLVLFVGPLAYDLIAEVRGAKMISLRRLLKGRSPFPIGTDKFSFTEVQETVIWLTFCSGSYILLVFLGHFFEMHRNLKPDHLHKNDLMMCLVQAVLLLRVGGVNVRLRREGFVFLAKVAWSMILYTGANEMVKGSNTSMASSGSKDLVAIMLIVMVFSLVSGLLRSLLKSYHSPDPQQARTFLLYCTLGVVAHAIIVVYPGKASFHFHHYYWGFLGTVLTRPNSQAVHSVTSHASAIFLGVWLNGLALFGSQPLWHGIKA